MVIVLLFRSSCWLLILRLSNRWGHRWACEVYDFVLCVSVCGPFDEHQGGLKVGGVWRDSLPPGIAAGRPSLVCPKESQQHGYALKPCFAYTHGTSINQNSLVYIAFPTCWSPLHPFRPSNQPIWDDKSLISPIWLAFASFPYAYECIAYTCEPH